MFQLKSDPINYLSRPIRARLKRFSLAYAWIDFASSIKSTITYTHTRVTRHPSSTHTTTAESSQSTALTHYMHSWHLYCPLHGTRGESQMCCLYLIVVNWHLGLLTLMSLQASDRTRKFFFSNLPIKQNCLLSFLVYR